MKIGPREQVILIIVAVTVIILALGGLLVWPEFQKMGELDTTIASAHQEAEAAKNELGVLRQSKSRAAETDAKWLRIANLVPDGPDLPSLIVELQDAAFASGVQLVSVTPAAPTTAPNYYTLPITMQVIGTWSDTVDYLQRIMKLNRGIRVVESSSARTSNTEQESKENLTLPDYSLATSIKIEAYMIPSAAPSSTAAPVVPPATGN